MHEHGVTRRRFLGAAGGAAAAAAGMSLLPTSMRKALAASPERPLRSLDQIEHVMILMQENRSFDHYFGSLQGVRGFDDPDAMHAVRRALGVPPAGPGAPGRLPAAVPQRHDDDQRRDRLRHEPLVGVAAPVLEPRPMDNWVPTHRPPTAQHGPFTMGYYTRDDLPFHYALADAFTVCDSYFCSVMGPTHPNRVMAISGTIDPDGTLGGPVVDNRAKGFRWTTYPQRLQAAGVSWRYCTAYPPDTDLGWFQASWTPSPETRCTRTRWCRTRRRWSPT